jgi:diadenosine tetraphosphate (Ap4A) HIT family hydrolase
MSALYNLDAARGVEQRERMRALEAEGVCIFCRERSEPAEHEGEHWYVTRNDFPYEGTAAHYLIVARRHVRAFAELADEAGAELWAIRRELATRVGAPAYATVERSGDMRLNGGSVEHLHVHFVALGPEPARTVRFRVSARGADEED